MHRKRLYLMKNNRVFPDMGGVVEPLLDMEAAAELLSLTKEQLYEICRTRSRCRQSVPIPLVRIGKRKMFRASSLHQWVSQLEQNAQP
jgi:predicted DNA-binding transcriptional regulator AlpA